jgi:para-nitrobenzyl esterase
MSWKTVSVALTLTVAALTATSLTSSSVPRSATAGEPTGRPLAVVAGGLLQGVREGTVERFSAIPYAAAPVGELRWQSPRPPKPWGVRDASALSKPCAQAAAGRPLAGSSEDCLYLTVTRPSRPGKPRPVMVWVHGGSNTTGHGDEFDAARLADRGDVLVVTINYRLGIFGFFAYPGLEANLALQDQQAALRWVRRNAASFGGDPTNVTLFGESAGGVDSCAHLTSPTSSGLFDRVILQSGSCRTRIPAYAVPGSSVQLPTSGFFQPVAPMRRTGLATARQLGCRTPGAIACLRAKSVSELLPYEGGFGPAVGTSVLPVDPSEALRLGRFHRVPVLSGNTRDEMTLTTMLAEYLQGRRIDRRQLRSLLEERFGSDAAAIEQRYRVASADPSEAFAAIDTDRAFACPQLSTTAALSRYTSSYGYEFADRTAPTYSLWLNDLEPGASHASELAYLFDLRSGAPYRGLISVDLTADQRKLADRMIDHWTSFARSGKPGWPRFQGTQGAVQLFGTGPDGNRTANGYRRHHCDLWARVR